ncbi:helix-turn-helix transcriptional regulator [Gordonia sp. CPCC 205515]|uniref:helix-turn-helix domain-containing protein n=1 Tax=Gordonia sp. CPCC 205515 TaxID=3140791 RepID=UPI003AF35A7D
MNYAEDRNRRMLRARDTMDRRYAEPLDVAALAAVAHISPAHFSRVFKATFGETPHRYLQRRRIERASALLRETTMSISDISTAVGFGSFATFTRTFGQIIGETPSSHRLRSGDGVAPTCAVKSLRRPA